MHVLLRHQITGEIKRIKIGFNWVLFLFSWLYGIPLFIRGLWAHGLAVFALCVLIVIAGKGAAPLLGLVAIGTTIFYGIKGNELTAKRLLSDGWVFAEEGAPTEFARAKWMVPKSS